LRRNLSRALIKRRKERKSLSESSLKRQKILIRSSGDFLFLFLFISRDMIHGTIFFSFYCWPSRSSGLASANGQQKENEDVSTWIIDSWPWKSFLLLGFNLQHIRISLKLDRAVGWKRFQEKENDHGQGIHHDHVITLLFICFLSLFSLKRRKKTWNRSCETIVMNENTFLIFTGIHPSLSLFQENIETEVMDSWWRVVKRLFSFLLLVQDFTITLLNDQDYSPDGRLIVNVISEETRRRLPWRAINRWPAWSCRQGRDPAQLSFFFYKWSPSLKRERNGRS